MNPLFKLKDEAVLYLKNIPGWRTRRKIVVIECDDYGSIRMPSKQTYDYLVSKGAPLRDDRITKNDTLAGKDDLSMLFEVLNGVQDKNGNPAVMTPVVNVVNPDFEKIKESGYREYHYEKFTDTLLRYGHGRDVFQTWQQGMDAGIFIPEYHGREHIAVQLWLQMLQAGNQHLLTAFDQGFVALNLKEIPGPARCFVPGFYFNAENQIPFLKDSIGDGARVFKEIFGYTPAVMVPSNGIFHEDFEDAVYEAGIEFLHVLHRSPYPVNNGEIRYKRFITGTKNKSGLTYYTRNCAFEPTSPGYKGIELTLRQVHAAFSCRKPASISTHRTNFAGGINVSNRDQGLKELNRLLSTIVKKWPDVEFMSAGNALKIMKKEN